MYAHLKRKIVNSVHKAATISAWCIVLDCCKSSCRINFSQGKDLQLNSAALRKYKHVVPKAKLAQACLMLKAFSMAWVTCFLSADVILTYWCLCRVVRHWLVFFGLLGFLKNFFSLCRSNYTLEHRHPFKIVLVFVVILLDRFREDPGATLSRFVNCYRNWKSCLPCFLF